MLFRSNPVEVERELLSTSLQFLASTLQIQYLLVATAFALQQLFATCTQQRTVTLERQLHAFKKFIIRFGRQLHAIAEFIIRIERKLFTIQKFIAKFGRKSFGRKPQFFIRFRQRWPQVN